MKKLIYSNPDCDYQRFPNAFQLKHFYVSNKDVVANANKLWKEMKNSKNKVFIFLKNTYNHILFTRSLSWRWKFLYVRNKYSMIEYFSSTKSMIIFLPCQNVTHRNKKRKYFLQRSPFAINKNHKWIITRILQLHKSYKLWKMSPPKTLPYPLLIRTDFINS